MVTIEALLAALDPRDQSLVGALRAELEALRAAHWNGLRLRRGPVSRPTQWHSIYTRPLREGMGEWILPIGPTTTLRESHVRHVLARLLEERDEARSGRQHV